MSSASTCGVFTGAAADVPAIIENTRKRNDWIRNFAMCGEVWMTLIRNGDMRDVPWIGK